MYKVIMKIIVARLCPLLSNFIASMQTSLVLGRKGIENFVIVQELLHTISSKKGNVGYTALKIDLEKAYDRLKWSLIDCYCSTFQNTLWMWSWVVFPHIVLLCFFNGGALKESQPSQNIRQGYPLSSYLFIMCMAVLGFQIKDKCDSEL